MKKKTKEQEVEIATLESKNKGLESEISQLKAIVISSNTESSSKVITSLNDYTEKYSLSEKDDQLLSTHPSDIILHLSAPNGETLKNFRGIIPIGGTVQINGVDDIGNFLRNNDLTLIPVIENGDFLTYSKITVNADGTFQSSWPIKSIKGKTFWVGLFGDESAIGSKQQLSYSPHRNARISSTSIHFN